MSLKSIALIPTSAHDIFVTHTLFCSVVGRSIRLYASGSSTQPLACAEIELVKANDPADTDIIVAFPETNDFERYC